MKSPKEVVPLKERIAESIWQELNDEAFFLPTEKLNKTAERIISIFAETIERVIGKNEDDQRESFRLTDKATGKIMSIEYKTDEKIKVRNELREEQRARAKELGL